ncbi:MAG: hypothetical protein IKG30_09850 [Clostridiales bacterium]|nr:hypothetical protein [Clostridiales bacterium]
MFKRAVSVFLVTVISLIFFVGCSSASNKSKKFDAGDFVYECRILVPSSQYDETKLKNFEIDFIRAVFQKFGESDYYKNMTNEEREAAINDIAKVLQTFSYGKAATGFIDGYTIDMKNHRINCQLKNFEGSETMVRLPEN